MKQKKLRNKVACNVSVHACKFCTMLKGANPPLKEIGMFHLYFPFFCVWF